jgi:hypothetical protein
VDPPIFQSYVSWAYSPSLNIAELTADEIGGFSAREECRLVAKCLELYILGDVLDDIRLRNKVLQTLALDIRDIIFPEIEGRAWEKTPENSPMRRMMVDRAMMRGKRSYLLGKLDKYPEDFVQRFAAELLQEVPIKDKKIFDAKLPSYLETLEEVD